MSDEYYLSEAERKIAAICKEAQHWDAIESDILTWWWIAVLTVVLVTIVLLFVHIGAAITFACLILCPIMGIQASNHRKTLRAQRYADQLERAIEWRDSLKRKPRGF
jgi:hypothetical protein